MATHPHPQVAVLSIHPRFADAIMSGDKKVEFRKASFSTTTTHVLIYATSPVQRIVGAFRVAGFDVASPHELWERYGAVGAISRCDFNAYYAGRTVGVAIRINGHPVRLDLPLQAAGTTTPPQNFAYARAIPVGIDG